MTENDVRTGHHRSRDLRRVSRGVFLPIRSGLSRDHEWQRDLAAWLAVLPPGAVLTHVTAARLGGWSLPGAAEWLPVFAAVAEGTTVPHRAGLIVSRLRRESPPCPRTVQGLPVDTPSEVLLRCARDLSLLDLVPLLESPLRSGDVTRAELAGICSSPRAGVANLRRAASIADPRSESAWETVLRLFCWCLEIDVEVQPQLLDANGHVTGRGDLKVVGTRTLLEYDGAVHRTPRGQTGDLRRDRRLLADGHERLGFAAADLIQHPATTMADLDRVLGRSSDTRRLRRWSRLTAASTFTEIGRRRLLSRWSGPMAALTL